MASKKTAPAAAAPKAEAAPSADVQALIASLRERDEMNARLAQALESTNARLAALEASGAGMELLPPEEMPIFEVGQGGYYSADDVLYPEGVQIEDITGRMPLNEQLIPLNEPAYLRMEQYLASLPQHGTPSHEFVLEAAFRRLGDLAGSAQDRNEFFAGVLEEAGKIRMTQMGLLPGREAAPRAPIRASDRPANVPMMSNTRIRNGLTPLSHLAEPLPQRAPASARMRAPAAAPASKTAPPLGTVAQTNLGTAGTGTRAA